MSLLLITNPPSELTVSTNWGTLVSRSGKNMLGFGLNIPVFTLTNWDSGTSKPAVAKGAIVEVGGSFYQADADTSLTDEGGLADGVCHIKLVIAGGGASVVPTLTNDSIPAWDAEKSGWYDGTDKFLPYELTQGGTGTTWSEKGEYNTPGLGSTGKELTIGHVYWQLPGKKSPKELGYVGTWTNISSSFAGDFFRAEGGDASSFESGQQAAAIQSHTHSIPLRGGTISGSTYYNTGVNLTGVSSLGTDTSGSAGGGETRPVNRTIRLWERTA